MPVGGTNYGALFDTAAAAFGNDTSTDRYLVMLTDGGATDDDWRDHIGELKRKGIRVIGLGIGTASGGFIPDGAGGFVKDDRGAVVLARLESDNLRELAGKTGGVYRDAGDWIDLAGLLRSTVEAGRKGNFLERETVRQAERYQWLLGPALWCLLVSFLFEFPVRPTPRDIEPSEESTGRAGGAAVAGFAALLLALCPVPSHAALETAPGSDSARLGRVVGRLSSKDEPGPHDWAELARETVSWGGNLRAKQEPVPAGPVRDAIAAVDSGAALDPGAADWPALRSQLEDLLHPPRDKKPPPPQNQQNRQNQQNQKDSPRKEDQQRQQQQQDRKQPQKSQDATQKVGGTRDRGEETMARTNPELAPMLEKLDQLRGQDSPADLWQMIQKNEQRPPPGKPAKDW